MIDIEDALLFVYGSRTRSNAILYYDGVGFADYFIFMVLCSNSVSRASTQRVMTDRQNPFYPFRLSVGSSVSEECMERHTFNIR